MADKKRKSATTSVEPPAKKTKKIVAESAKTETKKADLPSPDQPQPAPKSSSVRGNKDTTSKKTSKHVSNFSERVSDFMSDGETQPSQPKKSKSGRKDGSLTADGVNGVVEHADDEGVKIATTKKPAKDSMMAEAERTADAELEEEFGGVSDNEEREDEIDHAPALLAGFDSDSDDSAEDTPFDKTKTPSIPQFKKTSKKLRNAAAQKSSGPGAVYIGRIPHGFYEQEMRAYFAQFGTITRLRLSRNKRTGASKHFAFVEFDSEEVAKIVAETMDNYLMFGHILKCKFAPTESLHPDVWKGANKKFRKLPHHRIAKQKEEQPKTIQKWEKKNEKEKRRREKKAQKMKEIGYEFHMPELADPGKAKEKSQTEAAGSMETEQPTEGIKPVQEDAETKPAKAKKDKKNKKKITVADVIAKVPETSTETVHKDAAKLDGSPETKKSLEKGVSPATKASASSEPSKSNAKTRKAESKEGKTIDKSQDKSPQPKSILKKSKKT